MEKAFKLELDGISRDKIYAIISEVFRGDGLSRDELAEVTDMSNVTAGKIVSAMLARGMFTPEEQFIPRKRAPEKIFPSDKINILVFCLSEYRLSAALYNLRKSIIFSSSRPPNESLPIEFDVSAFADSIEQNIAELTDGNVCEIAVSTDKKSIPMLKYAKNRLLAEAEFLDEGDCIADYMQRAFPSECAAYIKIDRDMSVRIFNGGVPVGKSSESRRPLDGMGERSVISFSAEYLTPIFQILAPSSLLIDSEILSLTPRFVSKLRSEIKRASRLEDEKMPDITVRGEHSFAALSAIGQMCDKLSRAFAGIE